MPDKLPELDVPPFPIEELLSSLDREVIKQCAEEIVSSTGEEPVYLTRPQMDERLSSLRGLAGSFLDPDEPGDAPAVELGEPVAPAATGSAGIAGAGASVGAGRDTGGRGGDVHAGAEAGVGGGAPEAVVPLPAGGASESGPGVGPLPPAPPVPPGPFSPLRGETGAGSLAEPPAVAGAGAAGDADAAEGAGEDETPKPALSSEEVRVALKEIQSRVTGGGSDAGFEAMDGGAPIAPPGKGDAEDDAGDPDLGALADPVATAAGSAAAAATAAGPGLIGAGAEPEPEDRDGVEAAVESEREDDHDHEDKGDGDGERDVPHDVVALDLDEPEDEDEPAREPAVPVGAAIAASAPPPPMPSESEVAELTHQDRRLSLALVGVGMIVFAAGWALLVPVVQHFGSLFIEDGAVLEASASTVPLVWCVFWATVFLMLGFGAIFSRRWARVMIQSVGWFWFLAGAIALASIWYFYGEVTEWVRPFAGGVPGGAERAMVWVIGVIGGLFVFVPGFLILYFSAPSVRATCRAYDPRVRWTDRRPVGSLIAVWVLVALALWAAWCAWSGSAFPLYGRGELTELRASQVWAGIAGGLALLALANFFPRPWVWIVTVLALMAVAAPFAVPAYLDFSGRRFAAPETTAHKVVVATLAFWLFVVLGYLGLAGCFGGRKRHEAA